MKLVATPVVQTVTTFCKKEWQEFRRDRSLTEVIGITVGLVIIIALVGTYLIGSAIAIVSAPEKPHRPVATSSQPARSPEPKVLTAAPEPVNIEPSICTTTADGVTAVKSGDICSVSFDTNTHRQIIGIGGWCDGVNTTAPAPEGSVIVELRPLGREAGPDTFTFFTGADPAKAEEITIRGVILSPDGSGAAFSGTLLCNEQHLPEDRN